MKNIIVKSERDNVGNALEAVEQGDEVAWSRGGLPGRTTALDKVPFGFKMALEQLPAGADVIGYGEVIGMALRDIRPGELVHIHNMAGKRGNPAAPGSRA